MWSIFVSSNQPDLKCTNLCIINFLDLNDMTKTNLHQSTFVRLNGIGKNEPNMKTITALGLLTKTKITHMHQIFFNYSTRR